jgi:hypothetical protein
MGVGLRGHHDGVPHNRGSDDVALSWRRRGQGCRHWGDGNTFVMLKETDLLFRRFDQARMVYQQT